MNIEMAMEWLNAKFQKLSLQSRLKIFEKLCFMLCRQLLGSYSHCIPGRKQFGFIWIHYVKNAIFEL